MCIRDSDSGLDDSFVRIRCLKSFVTHLNFACDLLTAKSRASAEGPVLISENSEGGKADLNAGSDTGIELCQWLDFHRLLHSHQQTNYHSPV